MKLLKYSSNNVEEIKLLFNNTFSDTEGQDEGLLIGNLSYDLITNTPEHDLYVFIALENKQIIGSIIFSRLTFANNINAFILGPVAIHTNHQRKGVGQKLINFGINILQEDGVELVFTYGDPKYYSKVGFTHITEKLIKAPLKLTYPEGWLCQALNNNKIEHIKDKPQCVEAFNKQEFW